MLTNFELEDLAKKYQIPNFAVLSKDEFKGKLQSGNYILNMENEKDEFGNYNDGSHWVAVFVSKYYDCCYFDSFGFQPPQVVLKQLRKSNKKIYYNSLTIQNIRSSLCGWYCLVFLMWMNNNIECRCISDKYMKFVNMFNPSDWTKNDDVMKSLIKKLKK